MMNATIPAKFATGFFFFLAILFYLHSFSLAGESPVSVTTRITPDTFTLGDIATYTIGIQHDQDIQPTAPDIELPKGLEFIGKGENPPQRINRQTLHEYWYKFRIDDVGNLVFPSIPISFNAPDKKETGKNIQGNILAPEVNLEVQSLLSIPGSQQGTRDIKPLEEYPLPWMGYFWRILEVLALLGLFYFLWCKWKSRSVSLTLPSPTSTLTAEQLALKKLEALKNKGWLQLGRIQDHFFELSEVFREYLENRYQFPAREWTTEEIAAHFKDFPALRENLKLQAQSILIQTDKVKFAKAHQIEDEMQPIINFIQEARPLAPQSANPP